MTAPPINLAELRALVEEHDATGFAEIDSDDLLALIDAVEAARQYVDTGLGRDQLEQALARFQP